jgi:hypothetical protein
MRDVVLAIVIALVLFGAWKLIALAFALGGPMKREGISPLRALSRNGSACPCYDRGHHGEDI